MAAPPSSAEPGHPPRPDQAFRVAFVPGVTPDKWVRIWKERIRSARLEVLPIEQHDQLEMLHSGRAEMVFIRLPIEREGIHVIPLYRETPVVVASKEHPVAAFDEVSVRDLAGEYLLQDPDSVPEWGAIASHQPSGDAARPGLTTHQAIETAAAGTGIVIVPLSVARLHHRKDVVHRPVTDVEESQVGLAWKTDADNPLIEAFIGIVRGRTERSSR
jgi:DNA-binding transcriptional LysR family regulator